MDPDPGKPQIVVRRAEPDDFEAFWRIFQDESAYSGTSQLPLPSREAWRKRLAEPVEGDYVVVACVDGEVAALMRALVDLADNWLNVFRLELTVFVASTSMPTSWRVSGPSRRACKMRRQ